MRASFYRLARTLHADCGGRLTPRENLHQTLVFIGNVPAERILRLESLAANVRIPAFKLEFGMTGYWRHNRLVWAAPHATPEPLRMLVAALEQGLQRAGLRCDERPYASHVTLIRDARAPATLPPLAFDWPLRDFALVESVRGGRGRAYRVLSRRALNADPADTGLS